MTSPLLPLIGKLAGHRVLCIGDIMLDRYVYGQVERVSPEAPIPVLREQRESVTLGGAGNVVRNLVALGGMVDLVGIVGQDSAGYEIAEQISSLPQIASYVLTDSVRPTTLKTRFVANGQQLLRVDHEIAAPISSDTEQQILQRIENAIKESSIVILSDYAKGVLTSTIIRETINLAKSKNLRVLVDPKGRDFSRYQGASLLTPNRRELSEATSSTIATPEDAEKAARKLISSLKLEGVLAKLGGDGVCLVMKDQPALHDRATAREVYDVSGAGDTVVATLALALAGGVPPHESASLANIAGAIVVGKIGTATVAREELERELLRGDSWQGADKTIDRAQAAEIAERWRKQGLKVGFTNGCFDLLHPGHISLLRQARAACDKLIVGLNSDNSVRRLKGESRPIQNEASRATVLASIGHVEKVVVFEEDTPIELIKAIRPDVLVKGADYKVEQVVGGDLVKSWGGEVRLAKLEDGHSTTATISRLRKKEPSSQETTSS
ncbi:MAG: D-glycero-beta-D-manno-heptose-7-phosphate kinase [Bdellovibrionales bacterium]